MGILQHQTCKQCGRRQRFEFVVSDELWRLGGGNLQPMCIECWLERLDHNCNRIGISYIFEPDSFRHLSIVGDNVNGVLQDLEEQGDDNGERSHKTSS